MGHTKPPFTMQYEAELAYFRLFRRGLLRKRDKFLYDRMWQKAETFITPAEYAGHPLPGITILLMINLGQEIMIGNLEQQIDDQSIEINNLRSVIERLEERIFDIENGVDKRLAALRDEMMSLKYDEHIA